MRFILDLILAVTFLILTIGGFEHLYSGGVKDSSDFLLGIFLCHAGFKIVNKVYSKSSRHDDDEDDDDMDEDDPIRPKRVFKNHARALSGAGAA